MKEYRTTSRLRDLGRLENYNKQFYKDKQTEVASHPKWSDKRKTKLMALIKGDEPSANVGVNYAKAKLKAKMDKSFKNSKEYKMARDAYRKNIGEILLFGFEGHRRIGQLKNLGKSEKRAKVQAFLERVGASVAVAGSIAGVAYLASKTQK